MIYDITNRESFENLKNWIQAIRDNADPDIIIYLVGNKTDMCGIAEESSQSEEDSDIQKVTETQKFDEDLTPSRLRFRSISRIPFTRTVNLQSCFGVRKVYIEDGENFTKEHKLAGFSEVSSHNRREIKK